jgi:hypothetical protein
MGNAWPSGGKRRLNQLCGPVSDIRTACETRLSAGESAGQLEFHVVLGYHGGSCHSEQIHMTSRPSRRYASGSKVLSVISTAGYAFSPDGYIVAVGYANGKVKL